MGLSRRELAVLCGVVELYIRTGEAVASRRVARAGRLGLSPATVRNTMAELESEGWLSRSHSSAGCVPTDRAFRAYVDASARGRLSPQLKRDLAARMAAARRELLDDLEWVARLTAEVTREAGVAVRPMGEAPALEALTLVPLSGDRLLGVVVATDGSVEKRVLPADDGDTDEDLVDVVAAFRGDGLDEVRRQLAAALGESGPWQRPYSRRAAKLAARLLAEPSEDVEMWVVGTDRLLTTSDFSEVDRVRSLLSTLDDRSRLAREWRRAFEAGPTQVLIGRESELTAEGDLGMVARLYFHNGRRAGAIGVVGPTRMNYGRIVPVVDFIGETLTTMLEQPGAVHA